MIDRIISWLRPNKNPDIPIRIDETDVGRIEGVNGEKKREQEGAKAGGDPLKVPYLRPLQQPLFDRVIYPKDGIGEIVAFQIPIGQKFNHGEREKTQNDTNILQSSMLCYPCEFSILGFTVVFDPRAKREDVCELIANGSFRFVFSGRPACLDIPLMLLPFVRFFDNEGIDPKRNQELIDEINKLGKIAQSIKDEATNRERELSELERHVCDTVVLLQNEVVKKIRGQGEYVPYHRFNLGCSALKIRPGKMFNAHLVFPRSPKVSQDVEIVVALVGLNWSPL